MEPTNTTKTVKFADASGEQSIDTPYYRLVIVPGRPYLNLYDSSRQLLAELFIPSSVHPIGAYDDTVSIGQWQITETEEGFLLTLPAGSSVWEQKLYQIHCHPHRFTYQVTVVGQGRLGEFCLFGGYYSAQARWATGFFPSGQAFRRAFTPEPNADDVTFFSPAEGSVIDMGGLSLPGRYDWYFTPPPFAYAFESSSGWLAVGVGARPGQNRFTEFRYHGTWDSFYLALHYEGYTTVDGRYLLPQVSFDFATGPQAVPAQDPYEALAAHAQALREQGYAPDLARADRSQPAWWFEPIFSGWGAQCYIASQKQGGPDRLDARHYARQELYEAFLEGLAREDVAPGTVVIDDKWQAAYATNRVDEEKWPDLAGFIHRQHMLGRKVLLWLKAWDPEGAPVEQCITNAAGRPVAVDPTHPAYEAELRQAVRHMLSADGYDADGFKLDFTARIPTGPGMKVSGDSWGLELMKKYLAIIYSEAKATKADALIMTHTPHPYLADQLDMIRLNDIPERRPVDVHAVMTYRARVAAIACPQAVIDTDNWPLPDRLTFGTYLALQVELGVPSLYYSTHMDSTGEPLTAADYQLIRQKWQQYRAQQAERNRQ